MNLWVRKSGLIILSALTLLGCEEELSTVGLPPENNLGIFFVDVPLGDHISQVWVDSINSRATGSILTGSYQDEYFGYVEARNFSELSLPSSDPGANVADDAEFDSLVLEARISGIYGTNVSATPQQIEIYQLADTIARKSYTTASSQPLGQKLAASEFTLYPDSVNLEFKDTGRDQNMDALDSAYRDKFYDSNDKYIYKTTFRIDDAFAQDFFTKMNNSDPAFDSLSAFANYMKGISFATVPGNSAIINYGSTETKLVLYYTETSDDGTRTSKSLSFNVSPAASYNNIKPDKNTGWSGSNFDDLFSFYEPYEPAGDLAYIQTGTNLLMKLDLSIFNVFKDTVQNPVIQNAEIVFNNIRSVSGTTPPPTQLGYYVTSPAMLAKKNYRVNFLRDNNGAPVLSTYVEDDNQIKNDITLSLQSLLREKEYNQIIIAPVAVSQNGLITPDASSVNRLVVPKNDIRIRFYYTIPDQN